MMTRPFAAELGVFLLLAVVAPACPQDPATDDPTPTGPRRFRMGFTDFPHDLTTEGIVAAAEVVGREGDLSVQHFDDGVPWSEALNGTAYPASYVAELDGHASLIPDDHSVYLAVTPISVNRDGLARYRTDAADQPLPAPWNAYTFDHPDVARAFLNHCLRMIDRFQPDYFAFAIEVNLLLENAPGQWPALTRLLAETRAGLNAAHPALPTFVTLYAEAFHRDTGRQRDALAAVLPLTDYIAVSTYPYLRQQVLERGIPEDYFSTIADLAPGKPFAISETGWPAEEVNAPAPVVIPGSPAAQQSYVERLLSEAEARNTAFITWFLGRDYDTAWDKVYKNSPGAAVSRFFRDTGLFDGGGNARPGLAVWRQWFGREFIPRAAAIGPTVRATPRAAAPPPPSRVSSRPAAVVGGSAPGAASLDDIETTEDGVTLRAQTVVTGLERPSALAVAPDGRLFVTERAGRVRILTLGQPADAPALVLTDVFAGDDAGLLGLALDAEFDRTRTVYLYYTARMADGRAASRVVRFREAAGRLIEGIVLLDGIPAGPVRNGGAIRVGPDRLVYVGTGDASQPTLAQDLASPAGKVLRITRDGRTPRGNRFLSPVYSSGHRDPGGFDWHPSSGGLWAFDRGESGTDELNAVVSGADYGWPRIDGLQTMPGMQAPIRRYASAMATAGAAFYQDRAQDPSGDRQFPPFVGDLFAATARGLLRVRFDPARPGRITGEEMLFDGRLGRLTGVAVGPDGLIYIISTGASDLEPFADDSGPGRILRLVPAS